MIIFAFQVVKKCLHPFLRFFSVAATVAIVLLIVYRINTNVIDASWDFAGELTNIILFSSSVFPYALEYAKAATVVPPTSRVKTKICDGILIMTVY